MRTLAFICESCVFAYLGLALFSFPLKVEMALIIWSIIFILIGRALNIFPLAVLCNRFRQHRITKVRGVVPFLLSGCRHPKNLFEKATVLCFCFSSENDADHVVLRPPRRHRLRPQPSPRVQGGNQKGEGEKRKKSNRAKHLFRSLLSTRLFVAAIFSPQHAFLIFTFRFW